MSYGSHSLMVLSKEAEKMRKSGSEGMAPCNECVPPWKVSYENVKV
jgi:hypothetical protein